MLHAMTPDRKAKFPILVVEDSNDDFEALARGFRQAGIKNPLVRCSDGDEALRLLGETAASPTKSRGDQPGLVFLDLNLPGTDGRDVLKEMKTNVALQHIPVLVLTSSPESSDVDTCYCTGANTYFQKPSDLEKLAELAQTIKQYWINSPVVLPVEFG